MIWLTDLIDRDSVRRCTALSLLYISILIQELNTIFVFNFHMFGRAVRSEKIICICRQTFLEIQGLVRKCWFINCEKFVISAVVKNSVLKFYSFNSTMRDRLRVIILQL